MLPRYNLVIQDEFGNIVDGASVRVRREDVGLPLASIYSDRAGAVPLGNPFVAADGADVGFHVALGTYEIVATKGAFTKTWRYVDIGNTVNYGAPFDALAYNGMQINGSMEVSQENGVSAITIDGPTAQNKYTVDGFEVAANGAAVITAQQSTTAPPGFQNSLKCTYSTPDASLAAGEYSFIHHKIEGYRVSRLGFGAAAAQSVSFGFWVRSSKIGKRYVALRNATVNRSRVTSYTIDVADTWEFKTLTFSGDTSGTWEKTTSNGLELIWTLAAGVTFQTTADVWQAGNFLSVSDAINTGDTINATFYLTGVIVLPGIELPASDRAALLMRLFDNELMLSKRYLQNIAPPNVSGAIAAGVNYSTTLALLSLRYALLMRVMPALSISSASHFELVKPGTVVVTTGIVATGSGADVQSTRLDATVASGLTAGDGTVLQTNTASARLWLNARL